jgi:type I restriction enzyme M protein
MAIVLPHGALFFRGAEGHIRQYLIKEKNYLDAVIGASQYFYGTSIPTCILVLKANGCQKHFVYRCQPTFRKGETQNVLRKEDIDKIIAHSEKKKLKKINTATLHH